MPYLKLQTNVPVPKTLETQLLKDLSSLMAQQTGKPERYVLVQLQENPLMLFAGNDEPLAYLECKSIGLTPAQAKAISAAVAEKLNTLLQLPKDRIYIEFSNCAPEFWGWNAGTFG